MMREISSNLGVTLTLVNELRELGFLDHNPKQHAPPRPVSNRVPQSTASAPENHPIRGQF